MPELEKRLDDSSLLAESLKEDNRRYVEGFRKAGEKVTVIEDDYRQTICRITEDVL